ncbi:prostaglandin e synthase 2 [Plakobranchus ocellatus]|uniref:Prostaglandin E synthase 2 n=1 Tax=Plakobranchus ocellatus TaxID=259542 RepID=A0AAV3XUB4_9GAST|nr:prostaglandin e synthase 2 [Plakobranchus ocellatus]
MAAPFMQRICPRLFGQVIDYCSFRGTMQSKPLQAYSRHFSSKTLNTSWRRGIRLFASASAAVAVLGTGAGLVHHFWQTQSVRAENPLFDDKDRPYIKPSREVRVDTDNTGLKLTLYQYQTCPFCCKVRAVLDYHGFSYDVIEVNSITKKQLKWSGYPKVPVLIVEMPNSNTEVILRDSSVIISALESYLSDRSTSLDKYAMFYPCYTEVISGKKKYDFPNKYFIMYQETKDIGTSPKERSEERKWRRWADDHLVHMLSPNAYRTTREALQAFHYFSYVGEWEKNFSFFERQVVIYAGAFVMYIMGKILKSKYSLKDDVRQSLYDACNEWVKTVKHGKQPFFGGVQPNLADLAVYGVLNSIEGCTAFEDTLKNTNIGPWYNRTKAAIQQHQGSHPLHTKVAPSDMQKEPSKK